MATIYIDDELWKTFRIACIARDTSASKTISRLIEAQLQQWKQEQEPTPQD